MFASVDLVSVIVGTSYACLAFKTPILIAFIACKDVKHAI